MWDYCILSKLNVEKSSEELGEGDQMHLNNFDMWVEFFSKYNSLSKCEQWYLKFKGNHGKEVYSLFELFKKT